GEIKFRVVDMELKTMEVVEAALALHEVGCFSVFLNVCLHRLLQSRPFCSGQLLLFHASLEGLFKDDLGAMEWVVWRKNKIRLRAKKGNQDGNTITGKCQPSGFMWRLKRKHGSILLAFVVDECFVNFSADKVLSSLLVLILWFSLHKRLEERAVPVNRYIVPFCAFQSLKPLFSFNQFHTPIGVKSEGVDNNPSTYLITDKPGVFVALQGAATKRLLDSLCITMLVDDNDDVTITKDNATILRMLWNDKHLAAKIET
ncbi:hypothetical protein Tco_0821253, partial [Tanacetum coccineum]